jgi:hypothetical protein
MLLIAFAYRELNRVVPDCGRSLNGIRRCSCRIPTR